jgi:outer membrane lipoprotein SlyB
MTHRLKLHLLALMLIATVSGCAKPYSPDVYSPGGMQQANKVERATIDSVRQVDVNDPSLGLGTFAGAAAGGIAGSQIGKGGGNAAAILGGVLIGGAIGWLIEQDTNATTAYEYILEKKNGDLITLAQKQEQPFMIGDHVFILYGVQARVIPDTTNTSSTPAKSQK